MLDRMSTMIILLLTQGLEPRFGLAVKRALLHGFQDGIGQMGTSTTHWAESTTE